MTGRGAPGAVISLLCLLLALTAAAQPKRYAISGTVRDASTGEDLISATVYAVGAGVAATNAYGFFSLPLPAGDYQIVVSHLGYATLRRQVRLASDQKINFTLVPQSAEMERVVVESQAPARNANVAHPEMSVATLSAATIGKIPTLMGETDVIKALQLLPGVQGTSDGSSSFSVRGGGYDQNLIVLDEATVYSASHLMGFFSVFNNDAIKDVKLYKGDIPASFGGRLSSLVDIRSKDGNANRFTGTGGVGTISSRLTLEGPLAGDRATFLVSGRRTYADMFLLLASDPDLRESSLYFYDMNAKLNWRAGENDRLLLAGYLGRDKSATELFGMDFGNVTGSLRWNHIFSPRFFSNLTLVGSSYDYYLSYEVNERMAMDWRSRLEDYGAKADFSYHADPGNTLRFGYQLTCHRFSPGEGGGMGENSIFGRIATTKQYALEQALYASGETKAGPLTLKYGLRLALFQNLGNGDTVKYLDGYLPVRREVYRRGEVYKTQSTLEPRLGATWRLDGRSSLKASYNRSAQYIQLASNSSAGSPLDVWFQASPNVRPQLCDQVAAGYFRNFADDAFETSLEVYYKNMKNVIDFRDHAQLMVNHDLEQELRFGRGEAWGAEVMVRKNTGRLTGWVSCTFSRSLRRIEGINGGRWYRSQFDKPVSLSAVVNYDLSPRWSFSANWICASGSPVTYPTGRFRIENTYVPIYSGRNQYRYPAYHRLDVGATWVVSKPSARLHSELNFSLYNAYGRKNPWTILFRQEDDRPDVSYAEMIYLFSFVPSITWNFTF